MITFAPAYDEQTAACHEVAFEVMGATQLFLGRNAAVRETLYPKLSGNLPVFALAHGQFDTLFGQHDEESVRETDAKAFSNRVTFAFACHTSDNLGRMVSVAGGVWLGYKGAVAPPNMEPPFRNEFVRIFRHISERFDSVKDKVAAERFLRSLQSVCEEAYSTFMSLERSTHKANLQTYSSVRLIWKSLRIWLPGEPEPIHSNQFQTLSL